MDIDLLEVKTALQEMGKATALEMVEALDIQLTQRNRTEILSKVRSAMRKIVDTNGGKRVRYTKDNQLIYEL